MLKPSSGARRAAPTRCRGRRAQSSVVSGPVCRSHSSRAGVDPWSAPPTPGIERRENRSSCSTETVLAVRPARRRRDGADDEPRHPHLLRPPRTAESAEVVPADGHSSRQRAGTAYGRTPRRRAWRGNAVSKTATCGTRVRSASAGAWSASSRRARRGAVLSSVPLPPRSPRAPRRRLWTNRALLCTLCPTASAGSKPFDGARVHPMSGCSGSEPALTQEGSASGVETRDATALGSSSRHEHDPRRHAPGRSAIPSSRLCEPAAPHHLRPPRGSATLAVGRVPIIQPTTGFR